MAKTKKSELKKNDFIELDYIGKLEDGTIFDTTDEKIAKEAEIASENAKFGSIIVCLGASHILPGIEDFLIGKKPGKYGIDISPENGFGKKNAKLLTLLPLRVFTKKDIKPFPGLEVNIDDRYGIVRSVSGGRVIVDFNHPLAGRNLHYDVTVKNIIEEPLQKAKAIFKNELNSPDIKLVLENNTLIIDEKIPEDVLKAIEKRILELVPEIKKVILKKEEKKPKEVKTKKTTNKKKK